MAISNLFSLLILVAFVMPGRLFYYFEEQGRPSRTRSALAELTDYVLVGVTVSLISLIVTTLACNLISFIDLGKIASSPENYFGDEPVRVTAVLVISLLLALAISAVAGERVSRSTLKALASKKRDFAAASCWFQAFWSQVPESQGQVQALVELEDDRKIAGIISSFTVEEAETREIVLKKPLAITDKNGKARKINSDFVVVTEDKIRLIRGVYF